MAALQRARTCPTHDWDGDGAVTGGEVAILRAHLGETTTPATSALDLDGNGRIDANDEVLLLAELGNACTGLFVVETSAAHPYIIVNQTAYTLTIQQTFLAGGQLAHTGFQSHLPPYGATMVQPSRFVSSPFTGTVRVTALWMGDEDAPLRIDPPNRIYLPLVGR